MTSQPAPLYFNPHPSPLNLHTSPLTPFCTSNPSSPILIPWSLPFHPWSLLFILHPVPLIYHHLSFIPNTSWHRLTDLTNAVHTKCPTLWVGSKISALIRKGRIDHVPQRLCRVFGYSCAIAFNFYISTEKSQLKYFFGFGTYLPQQKSLNVTSQLIFKAYFLWSLSPGPVHTFIAKIFLVVSLSQYFQS